MKFVFLVAAVYLGVLILMMALEKSLVFFPVKYPEGEWSPPGLVFEDAWFKAADGTKLHGWYVPCDRPRAHLVYAHGNAGNLSHRWPNLKLFRDRLDVDVLIFDYRGYGRSEGDPSEAGIVADAEAARAWLAEKVGVGESDVVLYGESLGGGVMVDLASRLAPRGLILESTFPSLPDVAAHHYPIFPVRLLMRTRLDSASKIGRYHGPLLQGHGDVDSIIPYSLGQQLFVLANEPKRFVTLAGHDHNDPIPDEWIAAMDEFLHFKVDK